MKRSSKGQFEVTTGSTKYKTSQLNGRHMNTARKNWILSNGLIPKGMVIHHINENKKDDDIDNLQLMTYKEHNLFHVGGRIPWNKGLPKEQQPMYGRKYIFSQEAIKNQKKTWKNKFLPSMKKIDRMKQDGLSGKDIGKQLNITANAVAHRYKKYRRDYGGEKNE